MKLMITGGHGFIGSEICKMASEQGHEVVSVSLHGRPESEEAWVDRVAWVAADILDPESWRQHLDGCEAVVHCVGSVFGHENGRSLERINDDTTELVAWEAEHAGVRRFVFLSAKDGLPFVSSRFIESKRRAESTLRGRQFSEAILRPSFVYGSARPASILGARLLQAAEHVPGLYNRAHANRPLHVQQVARAAVRAATEHGFDGVMNPDDIAFLAGETANGERTGTHTGPARWKGIALGTLALTVTAGIAATALRRYRR